MTTAPFRINPPRQVSVEVALAPVHNTLTSLSLLHLEELPEGTDPWVAETAAALTPDQRRRNRLVFEGLGEALVPERTWADLPAYLEALAAEPPEALRDRMLWRICRPPDGSDRPSADPAALLADRDAFLAHLRRLYPADPVDAGLQAEVHALLNDPLAMQRLIVTHLRQLWETRLAAEWRRRLPNLQCLARKLARRDWAAETAAEAARAFLGPDLPPAVATQLEGARRLVVVLSPHIGPWASRFDSEDTAWLFVRDRAEDLPLRRAPVRRVELIGPLNALADETRLRILELLAERGELPAQEIIGHLQLSQSNVSRHLKQLAGNGFLSERRGDGANKLYRLRQEQVAWTFRGLTKLLSGQGGEDEGEDLRDQVPEEYRRLLDAQGRVPRWPTKRKEQELVIEYLLPKIEPGREYSEVEINETLNRWHTFRDPAILRRVMYGMGLLGRTADGARYWRV